jgi:hypothetical protein
MTPLEICIPASGVLAMVAAINFLHNAWNGAADRSKSQGAWHRRNRDKEINDIFVNLYLFLAAVVYAVGIFWLTSYLFE